MTRGVWFLQRAIWTSRQQAISSAKTRAGKRPGIYFRDSVTAKLDNELIWIEVFTCELKQNYQWLLDCEYLTVNFLLVNRFRHFLLSWSEGLSLHLSVPQNPFWNGAISPLPRNPTHCPFPGEETHRCASDPYIASSMLVLRPATEAHSNQVLPVGFAIKSWILCPDWLSIKRVEPEH